MIAIFSVNKTSTFFANGMGCPIDKLTNIVSICCLVGVNTEAFQNWQTLFLTDERVYCKVHKNSTNKLWVLFTIESSFDALILSSGNSHSCDKDRENKQKEVAFRHAVTMWWLLL